MGNPKNEKKNKKKQKKSKINLAPFSILRPTMSNPWRCNSWVLLGLKAQYPPPTET